MEGVACISLEEPRLLIDSELTRLIEGVSYLPRKVIISQLKYIQKLNTDAY